MTPAARVQTAIELLDEVVAAAKGGGAAADTILQRGFKARRYAGSGDRRAIRELVYAAIRRAGERPESGRAALVGLADERPELAELFDGSPRGAAPISPDEPRAGAGVVPDWLSGPLASVLSDEAIAALLGRAPLDLRANRLKTTRAAMLASFPDAGPTPLSPDGLRFAEAIPVERDPAYLHGLVEVQDEGSQLISAAVPAGPGTLVVDLCAGAGGKTLALAPSGARLVACDTDRGRLSRLTPRAFRAGADEIDVRLLDPGREREALVDLIGQADAVLVDAPCSGSGTWRRNPESRWRLTPDRLAALARTQAHVLDVAADLARPGGSIVYAVCSLLPVEGPDQIAAFLARHPGWQVAEPLGGLGEAAGEGVRLHPLAHGTDGFFVARLVKPC